MKSSSLNFDLTVVSGNEFQLVLPVFENVRNQCSIVVPFLIAFEDEFSLLSLFFICSSLYPVASYLIKSTWADSKVKCNAALVNG